ncbi:MAG: hypothetical protein HY842_17180 [Bacteroidetes bacterium]|nr:hypothetical protein [Bacteroidota bacterium]
MENKVNARWGIVAFVVVLVAMSRLVPHAYTGNLFNFSPLGGIALFGAAYFSKKYMAFLLPLLALWVSNVLIDNLFYANYYDGFAWMANLEVYFAFALIVALGAVLLKKINIARLLTGSLSASLIFFFVTNFYVWQNGTMYPKTVEGLATCYVAAIPFFWNTLTGDLFYVAVLFGAFEWVKKQYPSLVLEKI